MLVSQRVSDGVHFNSGTEQVSIKAVSVQISQRNEQNEG